MNSTDASADDTLDLHLPEEFVALFRSPAHDAAEAGTARAREDLLDGIADWGPSDTPAGVFHLVPADLERDVPLIARWMNDPAVAAYWELTGPQSVTADHLRAQLAGDGRSVPCVGTLDGVPMSYWEIYRADLDPLARYCPVRPHDTGVHLLIGDGAHRGRGLGTELIRAVVDLVLAGRPPARACSPNPTSATGSPSRRSSAPGSGRRGGGPAHQARRPHDPGT